MAQDTIRLRDGSVITGRIVCHLGDGRLELDVDGRRYTGPKVGREPRRAAKWM